MEGTCAARQSITNDKDSFRSEGKNKVEDAGKLMLLPVHTLWSDGLLEQEQPGRS